MPSIRSYENGLLGCELHPFCSPASIPTIHRSMVDTGHLVRVCRSGLAAESGLGILLGGRAVRLQNRFRSLLSLWDLDSGGLKIGSVLGHRMDGRRRTGCRLADADEVCHRSVYNWRDIAHCSAHQCNVALWSFGCKERKRHAVLRRIKGAGLFLASWRAPRLLSYI